MHPNLYHHITMVVKNASDFPAFFVIVEPLLPDDLNLARPDP
jgi:hypothetical protein